MYLAQITTLSLDLNSVHVQFSPQGLHFSLKMELSAICVFLTMTYANKNKF